MIRKWFLIIVFYLIYITTANLFAQNEKLIIEGVGFDSIAFCNHTFKDIVQILGNPDSVYIDSKILNINVGAMGYEHISRFEDVEMYARIYKYKKLGISFSTRYDRMQFIEKTNLFKNIIFLKGKTSKGIIVGESNLGEVIKKYGKNRRKIYFEDYSICYDGICFHFEAKNLNSFLIKYWEYQQLKVLCISVFPNEKCP